MADTVEVTDGWKAAAFVVVFVLMAAVAIYSFLITWWASRSEGSTHASKAQVKSTEDFITARSRVDVWKMAFSLYASVLGGSVVTGPASYASFAGLLGLASYAVAVGTPLLVVAWCGGLARSADPEATSLPNFLLRRFGVRLNAETADEGICGLAFLKPGQATATLSALLTLFVMGVALLAEYATVGTLFRSFVGCSDGLAAVPTIFVGLLTIAYTVVGGLYISVLTDRIQALVSFVLVIFLAIYLASDFDGDTSGPVTEDMKGFSYAGWSSVFTMPISLISGTIYSEALWQRVWAAEDEQALKRASVGACFFVMLVVFFFGFGGWLALWSGKATWDTDPNLYFFTLFSSGSNGILDSFAGLLTLSCAALMGQGAMDSLQNGITATLSSTLLKNKPLSWTRILVLLVNIPLAIVGATSWVNDVLTLFLLSNMITVSCLFPLMVAVIPGEVAKAYVTEAAVWAGCIGGVLGSIIFGIDQVGGDVADGLDMTFMSNGYGWDYFLVALLSSIGCTLIGIALSWVYRKFLEQKEAGSGKTPANAGTSPNPEAAAA
mmetsp:Transcript_20077/g.43727  ORF Transcript_20077/g.43727 Transcript_20077/m.43727 type:complete len:551 (+) Transcript_20077:139-1791(+)